MYTGLIETNLNTYLVIENEGGRFFFIDFKKLTLEKSIIIILFINNHNQSQIQILELSNDKILNRYVLAEKKDINTEWPYLSASKMIWKKKQLKVWNEDIYGKVNKYKIQW
jgi:hypothetical protein